MWPWFHIKGFLLLVFDCIDLRIYLVRNAMWQETACNQFFDFNRDLIQQDLL
ncbi:hypothetical protein V6x_41920 [Gimesia chilikensis]|uniref:Uncharacterized protein n=1 Tax=Gimesia chilikensis TaxID=2605989 RepID=A0A517WGT5_9PLAN|nr:hypothetical protein V6x_41920 [Gimesia chilikensis]